MITFYLNMLDSLEEQSKFEQPYNLHKNTIVN